MNNEYRVFKSSEVIIQRTIERGMAEWVVLLYPQYLPVEYFNTRRAAMQFCKQHFLTVVD